MRKRTDEEKELVKYYEDKLLNHYGNELKSSTRKKRLNEIFIKFKKNFLVDMYRRVINLQKNRFNYYSKA